MLSQGNNEGNSEGDPGEISAQLRRGTGKNYGVIPWWSCMGSHTVLE